MPSTDILMPFFVATAIFACVPGPGMFYAAAQTVARGCSAGWLSAVGFHIAGYVHVCAAAFGLAVLLETVPLLYSAVKLAGAGYLIWLGIKLCLSRDAPAVSGIASNAKPHRDAVRDSLVVEVLNPKTALFYLAFLPQFTDMSASLPVWAQVLILGAVVNALFSVTDAVCILLSHWMTQKLAASRRAGRWAQRIGGGVTVALGVNLATSQK